MSQPDAARRVDVLVVGAGQAGLAAARACIDLGLDCLVHERALIGDSWRRRFDSLVLFTPRKLSALPGLVHRGDPEGYPGKDEMGDYLERYAEHFALPVVTCDGITRLRLAPEGFEATTASGARLTSRAVIVATGAFQRSRTPAFARELSPDVQQLDAASYRNPRQIRGRRVIVVGDGATGRQVALELSEGHKTSLATGRKRLFGPQRLFGTDATELALRAGLLTADKAGLAGKLVRAVDSTPGLHLRKAALRRAGVEIAARCIGGTGRCVRLADGTARDVDAVIFACGYCDDTAWLEIQGAATAGKLVHDRGVGTVPGLFYVGREWQTSRASGLICGVARDAQAVAKRIAAE